MSTRAWMDDGTRLFLDTLAGIDDERLSGPIALPGWTGRHLVAHLHYNAEALLRLTQWAATGVENRMYPSPQHRAQEIDEGASLPPAQLRAMVAESADRLAAALDALDEQAWSAPIVTAQGRPVTAREIPWMRTREVYVHAVDLAAGTTFEDVAQDVLGALVADVVGRRVGSGEGPALAAWLTGRTPDAPTLGPWL